MAATFDRGELAAPANRDRATEQTIAVEVARFRKADGAPADVPPIVYLHGGPGYGTIDEFLSDSRFYTGVIAPLLQIADVVFVSQRGFGPATEMRCADSEPFTIEEAFDDVARDAIRVAALEQCRQRWEADGRDLTGINVVEAAADVADAARALGYDRIQIYGKSWGSHHGMALMRAYPDLVSRAALGALEGPDQTYDSPDGLLEGLRAIAAEAEASEALADHIPTEGLIEAYLTLIHRADREPILVQTNHPDTETPITVHLSGDDFRALARGVSRGLKFRNGMSAWPLDILEMLNGDFYWAARRTVNIRTSRDLDSAARYLFDCSSGITAERRARYHQSPAVDVIGPKWRDDEVDCSVWNVDIGDENRTGFATDIPTVLMQGTWDMNTPFSNTRDLRPAFGNHHFVAIEGGSHGAIREASEAVGGFENALLHWFATGDASQLPDRVVLPAIEWPPPETDS